MQMKKICTSVGDRQKNIQNHPYNFFSHELLLWILQKSTQARWQIATKKLRTTLVRSPRLSMKNSRIREIIVSLPKHFGR